jgi:phosphoglycerate dehydrogenase-like enzyme
MDQVILLPHASTAAHHTRALMAQVAVVNVIAWSEGKTALTPVPECPDMMRGSKAHLYTSGVLTMADH